MAYSRPGTVKITDSDPGFRRLAGELGEMGSVVIGVQGEEAAQAHPGGSLTVGQLAAAHELGLVPGAPPRSWLRAFMDANVDRLKAETASELRLVLSGGKTRKQALQDLGYKWTAEIRDRIWRGEVQPALKASTVQRKRGEWRPLLDTGTLMNSITYRVFVPNLKSIKDTAQRAAVRLKR